MGSIGRTKNNLVRQMPLSLGVEEERDGKDKRGQVFGGNSLYISRFEMQFYNQKKKDTEDSFLN